MKRIILKHRNTWCWGRSTIIILNNGLGIVTVSFEDETPDEATITGLSVYEGARNNGLGNILLNEAIKEAKEFNIKKLNIYADDETFTYKWYQRYGFKKDVGLLYCEHPNIKRLSKELIYE